MTEYKIVFFGNDEIKFLEFIDNNWSRIINAGYSSTMEQMESFEKPGYYVRFAKAPVVSLSAKSPVVSLSAKSLKKV